MSNCEILAPVGGPEALQAAVRAGADAVYFGATMFNARRGADNFNDQTLKEAIDYCRLNEVKAYLTLNTLIKDNELEDALSLAAEVYEYGIDAVIVQDTGLAALLHEKLPDLALHASTQMSVHSPAALYPLKALGFSRVVAAREMSKNELELFTRAATELGIEVEVFVHGALCMCLSGQCYFSAFLGGRSANRGLCAGTCRLPFSAKGDKNAYDLSLKDLSLIPYLKELDFMGVKSFKIEGRMKRPEYVACSVQAARQMLDCARVEPALSDLLLKVFSRDGFTDGYYTENLGGHMFGIRSEQDKRLSAEAVNATHELYRRERQRLGVDMSLEIRANKPCLLTVSYGECSVTLTGDLPEVAVNRPLEEEGLKTALAKLGGSCYFAKSITIGLDSGLMLPLSSVKALKNRCIALLSEQRLAKAKRKRLEPEINFGSATNERSINSFYARFYTTEQLLAAGQRLQRLAGYSLPASELVKALSSTKISEEDKHLLRGAAAELSRGAVSDTFTEQLLTSLKKEGVTHTVCSNLAALDLAKRSGFTPIGGFGLNLFNSFSLEQGKNAGLSMAVISPELSLDEIAALRGDFSKLMAFCYGRQPLMLTRNCPVKSSVGCKGMGFPCQLTDRLGQRFPVICRDGFCEILNCKITNISDCLKHLRADIGYLFFTTESADEASDVIEEFFSGVKKSSPAFTRGLYKNGVL